MTYNEFCLKLCEMLNLKEVKELTLHIEPSGSAVLYSKYVVDKERSGGLVLKEFEAEVEDLLEGKLPE